ncbi:MAG: sugar ABC transporter substrate-binding protein [Synergistaceae bacterium]|jgi:multiple sugar transport system substrate-binding protein|nr:sugar ABC transporter substrate-binding protein [Synergistaceae bacterium]
MRKPGFGSVVLLALVVTILSAFVLPASAAQTTLRVVAVNHPFIEAVAEMLPEFEKATGIKVSLETYGEDQLNQKLTTEFTAGSSNIDVFATRPPQEARIMYRNKWYADLAPYIAKTKDYDFEDFTPGSRAVVTFDGSYVTSIPVVTECQVVYYRRDLLEAKGLAVPKTLDDLYAAAEKLTDKDKEIYGIVIRGQRSPAITQFSSFLFSYGGDFFDPATRKATVNTPEALSAIGMYGSLLRNFGPEGALNMSWPQAAAIFAQGKAAFWLDASSLFSNVLDPAKSTVADKTGVAVFPAGPKGSRMYNICSWGLAMNNSSKQKDAAWQFLEYMTNKKGMTYIQGSKSNQCARVSVWGTAEGTKNFNKEWAEAVKLSANGIDHDRPQVVAVGEARDIIGEAITASIEGKDYKAVAASANERFQQLLDREK